MYPSRVQVARYVVAELALRKKAKQALPLICQCRIKSYAHRTAKPMTVLSQRPMAIKRTKNLEHPGLICRYQLLWVVPPQLKLPDVKKFAKSNPLPL